ncbi:MAG TPA: transcriptional regulator [Edaphobacter sp.]|nr:transcriptional regulator [Edaphobacter sp.]
MKDAPAKLPEIDRLIHEPARLVILTVLSSCRSADFLFLLNVTGLSKGNLSVQISRLEEAALVTVEKVIERKKIRTTISLTDRGRSAVEVYWKTMDKIRKQSRS